jgi:hypothetical protein
MSQDQDDVTMTREERGRGLSASGSEQWRLSLVNECGARITRVVYLTARAPERWWWKVDDGCASATLASATREVPSSARALHEAQREVLFREPHFAIVQVAKVRGGAPSVPAAASRAGRSSSKAVLR